MDLSIFVVAFDLVAQQYGLERECMRIYSWDMQDLYYSSSRMFYKWFTISSIFYCSFTPPI